MAERLKQEHDIVVLKVELLDVAGSADDLVRVTLQGRAHGRLSDLAQWETAFSDWGISDLLGPRGNGNQGANEPTLPDAILSDLEVTLEQFGAERRPLWVHLVKPYGGLRFVPWERRLSAALHVPVLMLPDFIFPRPREASSSLEVVVCASAPLGVEEYSVDMALRISVNAILAGSPRKTRVQIFTDAQLEGQARHHFKSEIESGGVVVHHAESAMPFVESDPSSRLVDRGSLLRSPWLLWMRQALRERAVDVVHFCCHGHLTRGRGALLFAQSPRDRTDSYLAGPVGGVELQTFLTQVGAWSTAFESLTDNHSATGLRGLADEIGQSRPGPLLLHDLREDPGGSAIADAYTFLYATEPRLPPRSSALFMYCQPYLVRSELSTSARTSRGTSPATSRPGLKGGGPRSALRNSPTVLPEVARNEAQADFVRSASLGTPTDALFAAQENGSQWLAATERFADGLQLHYQSLARDELLPESTAKECAGTLDTTLRDLRAAVSDLAARRGGTK